MRLAAFAGLAALALPCLAVPVADESSAASLIVERTNAFRHEQGLGAVTVDPRLARAAVGFAQYMARTGKYSHEADGREPWTRAEAQGYDYCLVLENIAYHYDSRGMATQDVAKKSVQGWKDSPPHRKNMQNPLVVHTGVGVARAANGYYYAVQMFGLPKSASVKFEVRNESESTVRYRVGDTAYAAPPRSIRTHQTCLREAVRFEGLAGGEQVEPSRGDHFRIPPEGKAVRRERR